MNSFQKAWHNLRLKDADSDWASIGDYEVYAPWSSEPTEIDIMASQAMASRKMVEAGIDELRRAHIKARMHVGYYDEDGLCAVVGELYPHIHTCEQVHAVWEQCNEALERIDRESICDECGRDIRDYPDHYTVQHDVDWFVCYE